MAAPLDRVKALLAALPADDQRELRRFLGDILLTDDEAEAIHLASLEIRKPGGRRVKYTYRSEHVRCGKATCWCREGGIGHGPYTYKYWKEGGRLRKEYVGKVNRPGGRVAEARASAGTAESRSDQASPA